MPSLLHDLLHNLLHTAANVSPIVTGSRHRLWSLPQTLPWGVCRWDTESRNYQRRSNKRRFRHGMFRAAYSTGPGEGVPLCTVEGFDLVALHTGRAHVAGTSRPRQRAALGAAALEWCTCHLGVMRL
jgi:hypothetical protein